MPDIIQPIEIDYSKKKVAASEFEERLNEVRRRLDNRGLKVGLAYATEHMPGDVQYLTGYDPHLENTALLVLPDKAIGLGGAEGYKMFEDGARTGTWRNLSLFEIPGQEYGDTRFWTLDEILKDELGNIPFNIGFLSAPNVVSFEIFQLLQQAIGDAARLIDVSDLLADMRYHKSPTELEMHRTSSRIATVAMRTMIDMVRPGVRELEIAAEGDCVVKKLGAYSYGFDTMVLSGPRINTIIGRATNRVIEDSDLVLLGVSPRYEGYTSALGHTIVAGGATREQVEFLEHGIQAYELAARQVVARGPAREIDLAARNYLRKVNLAKYHAYGVGHGIGLTECLEGKTATQVSDYNLPAGITIMLDVGLFEHPKFFGARHEDPFLINQDAKTEKLTDLPMRTYSKRA